MRIAYGIELEPAEEQHYIHLLKSVLTAITRITIPGAYLVEKVHALRHLPSWFPGAYFQKEAADIRSLSYNILDVLLQRSNEQVVCTSVRLLDQYNCI